MDRWLERVGAELGVEGGIEEDALLDAARVVAHSIERKMTPLTTYLIGVAAAQQPQGERDVGAICRKVVELAEDWER